MTASVAKSLAALRQLAALGLPGKSVLAETVGLLQRLAGFDLWAVRFMDRRLGLTDMYLSPEFTAALAVDLAENFHNGAAGKALAVDIESVLRAGQRFVPPDPRVDQKQLRESEFFRRVMVPVGMNHPSQIPLQLDGASPFAAVAVSRALGARDFSAATARLLADVQPWLCHLLSKTEAAGAAPTAGAFATAETGVLVLDDAGRIESASPGALILLLYALDQGLQASSLRQALAGDAGSLLKRLAGAVAAGINGARAPVPAATLDNRYGRFSLRAYALDAFRPGAPSRVSLQIERQSPVALRLFSAPRFLGLPNREREVALHLVRGRSHSEAAREMGVKSSSVIYHIRSLYRRLDIASRDQLVPALLGPLV